MEQAGIEINGHTGTWYVINEGYHNGEPAYLLESEIYGDEVPCLIVDKAGKIILDEVYNGFSDLEYI